MIYVAGEVEAAAEDKAISILSRADFVARQATGQDGIVRRKPPLEIVHPFGDMLEADNIKTHDAIDPNKIIDFSIENGVLIGDRAFLTPSPPLLLTDSTHPRHLPWIFESADRRNFEGLRLKPAEGGYALDVHEVECESIDGAACALTGMEYNNYGAFLVRLLPKIISAKSVMSDVECVIAPGNIWQRHILSCFGVDLARVVSHERGKIYSARNMIALGMRSSEMYLDDVSRDMFKEFADRMSDGREGSELLYVSRLNQAKRNPSHRRLMNEEELADALVQRGFTVFAPEEHAFEEQVRAFSGAKVIVGPGGAGMFNAVFCDEKALVISLEPMMNWIVLHSNVFASSGVEYALVVGGADDSDPSIQKRWRTDVDCILSLMKRLGV